MIFTFTCFMKSFLKSNVNEAMALILRELAVRPAFHSAFGRIMEFKRNSK
jgi:hypothetical protein